MAAAHRYRRVVKSLNTRSELNDFVLMISCCCCVASITLHQTGPQPTSYRVHWHQLWRTTYCWRYAWNNGL